MNEELLISGIYDHEKVKPQLDELTEAQSEFEKALLCNPACGEALQELKLSRRA